MGLVIRCTAALTPAKFLRELREHGTDAWCERIWIEDYVAHLK